MSPIRRLSAVLVVLAFVGCAGGTEVDSIWKDPTAVGPKGNLLIVGLSDNQTSRRMFEDALTSTLTAAGNQASQSYPVIPSGREADKQAMTGMLREKGFDAILTARAVSEDKEKIYNPEPEYFTPPSYYYSYWDFYSPATQAVSAPGYYTEETWVRVETNLYDADGKLIWTAATSTLKNGDMREEIHSLCATLTKQLEKSGLIK
ncbi:MAG TPA: hypothetical protein VF720_07110 [Candidatus Eisenbacteria bacterium]